MPELPHELRLLLACAHVHLTESQRRETAALLLDPVDTDRLYDLATRHGLTGLLYGGLAQVGAGQAVPALHDLLERLADDTTTSAALYEFFHPAQLGDLLTVLSKAQVRVLVLKGYALGVQAYAQPALRPYSDFDLLIRPSELDTAERVLMGLGYLPDESEFPRDWYIRKHHHMPPYVRPGSLSVELHTSISNGGLPIDLAEIWARAEPLPVSGALAAMLCPEHQLIHLAVHTVQVHRIAEIGLRPLWDVHELVMRYRERMSWMRVIKTSRGWGASRHVALMLRLVNALFGKVAPADVMAVLSGDPLDDELIELIVSGMLQGALPGMHDSSGLADIWQEPNPARRAQRMVRRMFPSRHELAERYGAAARGWRSLVYYPRWQADMIQRHAASTLRLLRSDPIALRAARAEAARRRLAGWLAEEGSG